MNTRQAYIVIGLGYGDEGKGATTDYLCRRHGADLVIRFNGGPQCGHNVVTADGRHHTFSQFGSGTLVGARTHLSSYTLINPINMEREARHLHEIGVANPFEQLTVEEDCVVITPFQRALNRLMEWGRGNKAHGSCGQGVGQAREDQINCGDRILYAGDLRSESATKSKLAFLQLRARKLVSEVDSDRRYDAQASEQFGIIFDNGVIDHTWRQYSRVPLKIVSTDYLKLLIERHRRVVFEGGQGVLLDETYGTAPHNTWTATTCSNANHLLREVGYDGTVRRIGVLRTYFTRHGRGPFPTEDWRLSAFLPEPHNDGSGFQGAFRVGHFDAEQARYAINVSGGVNEIALNHIDSVQRLVVAKIRLPENDRTKIAHPLYMSVVSAVPTEFIECVENLLKRPVTIIGKGATAEQHMERDIAEAEEIA